MKAPDRGAHTGCPRRHRFSGPAIVEPGSNASLTRLSRNSTRSNRGSSSWPQRQNTAEQKYSDGESSIDKKGGRQPHHAGQGTDYRGTNEHAAVPTEGDDGDRWPGLTEPGGLRENVRHYRR